MALICRMWITLRNGERYSRPDGKPICWEGDENYVPKKKITQSCEKNLDDSLEKLKA